MPEITPEDLDNRFGYHRPQDEEQIARHANIRIAAREYATAIMENTPSSREQSLALTALEESSFWANAGAARMTPDGERRAPEPYGT